MPTFSFISWELNLDYYILHHSFTMILKSSNLDLSVIYLNINSSVWYCKSSCQNTWGVICWGEIKKRGSELGKTQLQVSLFNKSTGSRNDKIWKLVNIGILNIFVPRYLTKHEYWIFQFVPRNLTEYEYQICAIQTFDDFLPP